MLAKLESSQHQQQAPLTQRKSCASACETAVLPLCGDRGVPSWQSNKLVASVPTGYDCFHIGCIPSPMSSQPACHHKKTGMSGCVSMKACLRNSSPSSHVARTTTASIGKKVLAKNSPCNRIGNRRCEAAVNLGILVRREMETCLLEHHDVELIIYRGSFLRIPKLGG